MTAKSEQEGAGASSSGADSTVSQAGAGAGGAQAGVGAEQRAAQSGAGQTDVAAGYRSSGAEVTSDVGQAEAYIINMKKLVADELDHAANLRAAAADSNGRRGTAGSDFDAALRSIATQALQNAVQSSQRINADSIDHKVRLQHYAESEVARTVRHSDLAIDRQWNVDEVAQLIAKTPVFLDAIAGAVASGVAKAVSEKPAA